MLSRQMAVQRIEQDALGAGRIVDDAAAVFRAVGCANDKRPHRVGAKVDAYREHSRSLPIGRGSVGVIPFSITKRPAESENGSWRMATRGLGIELS